MNYIVFDLEFTSWEGSMQRNWSGENEYKEIVQIAAIKVTDGKISDKLNILVKPNINPNLSDYFQKLTGIKNKHIKKSGIDIHIALEMFYNFSKNYTLYSYGNDYHIIHENLILNNVPRKSKFFSYVWQQKFKDFKDLLIDYDIDPSKYTSGTIYKAFNLKIKNHNVHNALDDAYSLYVTSKYILEDYD